MRRGVPAALVGLESFNSQHADDTAKLDDARRAEPEAIATRVSRGAPAQCDTGRKRGERGGNDEKGRGLTYLLKIVKVSRDGRAWR